MASLLREMEREKKSPIYGINFGCDMKITDFPENYGKLVALAVPGLLVSLQVSFCF